MADALPTTAFETFEACKAAHGEPFAPLWRHLLVLDPGHAAGVLLHTAPANLAHLTREDWEAAKPHVLALDDRVHLGVLARWALRAQGLLLLEIWKTLALQDAAYAAMVLRDHPAPRLDELTAQEIRPLLSHPSAEIRLAVIAHLGRRQAAGEAPPVAAEGQGDAFAQGLHEALRRGARL